MNFVKRRGTELVAPLVAAAAITGSRKGAVILAATAASCGGGGGGIRTGLKSRRYLLLVAVTSFNSYQFHGHTSLPGRYNGDFGGFSGHGLNSV